MSSLILLKIGGGLITDKTKPFTAREDVMQCIAKTVSQLQSETQSTDIILGNGGGSFAHFAAARYTPDAQTRIPPFGVCDIHQSAVQLNDIFIRHLLREEVPAYAVSPGSCVISHEGKPTTVHCDVIKELLSRYIVPVVYGDIPVDTARNGSVFSTEQLFELIIDALQNEYDKVTVIYAGNTPGVLDTRGGVIPSLSASSLSGRDSFIGKAVGFDVTGGMRHKVESALDMAKKVDQVYIVSGHDDSILKAARGERAGTIIKP